MATARTPIPPVNLKDRIAALQQRNAASKPTDPKAQAAANSGRAPGTLKDKIATFEKKGAVPVPRGSFGIGAPPVDDGSTRRHGELYGNRVPGLSRPVVPPPTRTVLDSPPGGRKRCVSTSQVDSSQLDVAIVSNSDESMAEVQAFVRSSPRRASVSSRHMTQRSVSDILPTLRSFEPVEETLPEHDMQDEAPVIVVSESMVAETIQDPHTLGTDSSLDPAHSSQSPDDTQTPQLVSEDSAQKWTGEQQPASEEAHQIEALAESSLSVDGSSASSPSAANAAQSTSGAQAAQEEDAMTPQPSPSVLAVRSTDDVSEAPDASSVSVADRTSYSSSSTKVSTPSSVKEFSLMQTATTQAPRSEKSADALAVLEPRDAMSPPPNLAVLIPDAPPTPVERGLAYLDEAENPDQSIALDAPEAIIISEPPRHVSPTLMRARLVPVSPATSASSASPVSPASTSRVSSQVPVSPASSTVSPSAPFVEPAFTTASAPRSFRAVVHGKVTPGSATSASRRSVGPSPQTHILAPLLEPSSPGFGDLATLLADAALLERQLSGLSTPTFQTEEPASNSAPRTEEERYEPEPAPAPKLEQAPQAKPEPERKPEPVFELGLELFAERPQPSQELPESVDGHDSDTSLSSPVQVIPSIVSTPHRLPTPPPLSPPVATLDTHPLPETPPPVPPKSPPRSRYFSGLLPRKLSAGAMPGAYPRDSVCSEMSSEDSVLVATPPSPRQDTLSSDASSVRSSTRSWKMGKKGLARATSFADRFLHRKESSTKMPPLPQLHDDDVHLSPHAMLPRTPPSPTLLQPTVRPQQGMSGAQRPTSWVSVSSMNSVVGPNGEILDSELFDAFPSVPDSMPSAPAYFPPSAQPSSYLSPADHLGMSHHVARAATLPARSDHPKQRSGLF